MTSELKVLSLNIWGLKFADDYEQRMNQVFNRLQKSKYDIVLLQEVFVSADINRLKRLNNHNFPYIHHFYSGLVGTGLMVLSKFPILDVLIFPYIQSGMVYHRGGDWFARKGVSYCLIQHPKEKIMVFGTHTHAKYAFNFFDELRTLQLLQLAKVVKTVSRGDYPVIVAGDLNTESFECCFKFLLRYCNLKDSCVQIHPKTYDDLYTCNHPNNPYGEKNESAKRIDYILHNGRFAVKNFCYDFESCKSKNFLYSDHTGVSATLELVSSTTEEKSECFDDLVDCSKLILKKGYQHSTVSIPLLLCIVITMGFIFLGFVVAGSLCIISAPFGSISSGLSGATFVFALFSTAIVYISRVQQKRAYKNALKELDLLEN